MKKIKDNSITPELLKQIVEADKERQKRIPTIGKTPIKSADLRHDAGNGYNAGFVFPQN